LLREHFFNIYPNPEARLSCHSNPTGGSPNNFSSSFHWLKSFLPGTSLAAGKLDAVTSSARTIERVAACGAGEEETLPDIRSPGGGKIALKSSASVGFDPNPSRRRKKFRDTRDAASGDCFCFIQTKLKNHDYLSEILCSVNCIFFQGTLTNNN
jgi:hypothetical protein